MKNCMGCLKENVDGYCKQCRTKLFDGIKVNPELTFTRPEYNQVKLQHSERLSISGIQTKHSMVIENNELVLTNKSGGYILKPIPTGPFDNLQYVPINENLTMQIAKQIFKINTAENGLVKFKDGGYAYITKRFDIKDDGSKILQEDMAQVTGRSSDLNGSNYKYDYSYEELAEILKIHVGAYPIEVEKFFNVILFNYLFCNGDAHLKNFSVYREEEFGSYILTPFYDLLNTHLHVPEDSDMALELFKQGYMTKAYKSGSKYTQDDFVEFGQKIGMVSSRIEKIIMDFTTNEEDVKAIVERSLLDPPLKERYIGDFIERLHRIEK